MKIEYISPAHDLAALAAIDIRSIPADRWIAVIGAMEPVYDPQTGITTDEVLFDDIRLAPCDQKDWYKTGLEYVQAGDWIATFDASRGQ